MPPRSPVSRTGPSGRFAVAAEVAAEPAAKVAAEIPLRVAEIAGLRVGGPGRPDALRALLADLGSQIRRGGGLARGVADEQPSCATGIPGLDARLGGGFPRGRLSELCGAPSSGRTSLAMRLLAETLARGGLAAWIDPADAFDPASASAALDALGHDAPSALARLLWVRARSEKEAIRSSERVLACEGFELVLLDLAHGPQNARGGPPAIPGPRRSDPRSAANAAPRASPSAVRDAGWLRLARRAARQRSALVVLSNAPQTGHHAELVLELERRRARFSRPPALLDALESAAILRRHRTRPLGPAVPLSLDAEGGPDVGPEV